MSETQHRNETIKSIKKQLQEEYGELLEKTRKLEETFRALCADRDKSVQERRNLYKQIDQEALDAWNTKKIVPPQNPGIPSPPELSNSKILSAHREYDAYRDDALANYESYLGSGGVDVPEYKSLEDFRRKMTADYHAEYSLWESRYGSDYRKYQEPYLEKREQYEQQKRTFLTGHSAILRQQYKASLDELDAAIDEKNDKTKNHDSELNFERNLNWCEKWINRCKQDLLESLEKCYSYFDSKGYIFERSTTEIQQNLQAVQDAFTADDTSKIISSIQKLIADVEKTPSKNPLRRLFRRKSYTGTYLHEVFDPRLSLLQHYSNEKGKLLEAQKAKMAKEKEQASTANPPNSLLEERRPEITTAFSSQKDSSLQELVSVVSDENAASPTPALPQLHRSS